MIDLKVFVNIAAYSNKTLNCAPRHVHRLCADTC